MVMIRNRPNRSSVISALAAMAAVLLTTCFLALIAQQSRIYQHGMIFSMIARQGQVDFLSLAKDPERRAVMSKFISATMTAYLDFEMLPYGEAQTFTAVFQSLGEGVHITGFGYRRRDLMISGHTDTPDALDAFVSRLSATGHFATVIESGDSARFEIWCVSSQAIPAVLV